MERGGKIALFWLYYPTPKASDIQCQEETPHLERVLLLGKQRAEWVAFCTSFFFFFFLPILCGSTSVSSPWRDQQSWGSQRWSMTRKKRRSYQYQPHNRSNGISSKMFCRQPQQFLTLKESKASTAATDHLKISSAFFSLLSLACTTVFTLPAAYLTTIPYLPSPASTVTCSAIMAVNTTARGGWGLQLSLCL